MKVYLVRFGHIEAHREPIWLTRMAIFDSKEKALNFIKVQEEMNKKGIAYRITKLLLNAEEAPYVSSGKYE